MTDLKPVEAWAGRRPDGTICFGTIAGTDEACHAAIRERELALEGHNYYKPESVMIVPMETWEKMQGDLAWYESHTNRLSEEIIKHNPDYFPNSNGQEGEE